jgi:gamma-glutamyltranspeptidase
MFVLKGGQLHSVIGASGGLHIVSAVLQILHKILIQEEDPLVALVQPRIEHHFSPDSLFYESYSFKNMSFNVSNTLQIFLEDKVRISQQVTNLGPVSLIM